MKQQDHISKSKPHRLIKKIREWEEERDSALTPAMQHVVSLLPQIELDESVAELLVTEGSSGSRHALGEQFTFIKKIGQYKFVYTSCKNVNMISHIKIKFKVPVN